MTTPDHQAGWCGVGCRAAPTMVNWLGPALRADTAQVLETDLGLERDEVERLADAGVIALA